MSNSEKDILPQQVRQICPPWDAVASLSPYHSSNPGKNMSAKLRPSGSNAINWRFCAFVAACDAGGKGPPWFIKGCSTCGQWLENALKASPGKEYGNGSSKIVYKPASDDSRLFVQLFLDPVQILPSHMPLILFMKELVHQEIAGLTLDKSAVVTI